MPALAIGDPHLLPGERALMDRVFAAGCRRYLEFGLGGSTLLAVRSGAEAVVAVDSDREWAASVRGHPEVAPLVSAGTMTVLHADIGRTGPWGAPVDRSHIEFWPRYVGLPWAEWGRRGALPDVVYVDGRFRVACCLSVALAAAQRPAGDGGPVVMLHDVRDDRPYYGEVFNVFDTVEAANTLRILRVRPDVPRALIVAKLLEYQFDYR